MQKYTCKTCEAELYWDSSVGALKCEYCDSTFSPDEFNDVDVSHQKGESAEEYHDQTTDDSDASELVVYKCTECGAEIVTAKGTVATTCAYCNRAITMSNKMIGNFKPKLLIPFNINKKQAKEIFKKYAKSSFLAPKEFQDDKLLTQMKGLYVPFWLHTFKEDADVQCLCENTTTRRRGDDKVITHYEYQVNMKCKGVFFKLPTDALEKLDNKMMDNVEPFDYANLKEFNPAYMAGFYAEQYTETVDQTFPRAHDRAVESMKREALKSVSEYSSRKIRYFQDDIREHEAEYAMLPIWILNTEYKNQKYTFAINGDTGKITGKIPLSISKLISVIGGSFIATQLIGMLFRLLGV